MARAKDLWHSEAPDPADPKKKIRKKTARHPDNGGSREAKRWLAVWIGPDGREKTKAFRTQDAAKKHARKQEEDVERGEYLDPAGGKQQFGALGKRWLKLRKIGASSRERYEGVFRVHIEPVFGERQLKSVRPSEILEWLNKLAETHSNATQSLAHYILCGIYDLAVADGLRRDNPVRSPIVPRPRREPAERELWAVEKIWAVIDAHPAYYRTIPIVAAGCGLRQGEALGLAIEDFDFDKGVLNVRRQLAKVGRRGAFKLPKSGKARVVPLPSGVARAVQAHAEEHPPRPCGLPWLGQDGKVTEEEHVVNVLFRWQGDHPSTRDRPIRSDLYDPGVWKPALVEVGVIPPPTRGRRSRLVYESSHVADGTHNLRHYYSATLQDGGVALAGVMDFLGHSRKGLPITVGVYGHVTPETFERARQTIDRSLFRLRAVQDQKPSGTVTELAAGE